MDRNVEVAEFLRSRRGRIAPDQAGLIGGGRRRVTGLRREEVALLAGVSMEYYARMERGDLSGVSPEVLASVSRTLKLDEAEAEHLRDLANAARRPFRPLRRPAEQTIRPSLQRLINAIVDAPVLVRDRRLTVITTNTLARALYAPILDDPANQSNTARFMFLNPAAETFFPEWDRGADEIVGTLRRYAGQHPHDKTLTDLVGELVTRSDEFRERWAKHNVRFHQLGIKRVRHPLVGELELEYEAMELPANPEWFMFGQTAKPGSPSEERLKVLGSLAATQNGNHGQPPGR